MCAIPVWGHRHARNDHGPPSGEGCRRNVHTDKYTHTRSLLLYIYAAYIYSDAHLSSGL